MTNDTEYQREKWGKFVDTNKYGQALLILNQQGDSDGHGVLIIARHPGLTRVKFTIPFEVRAEAKPFLQDADEAEVETRLNQEIERLLSLH